MNLYILCFFLSYLLLFSCGTQTPALPDENITDSLKKVCNKPDSAATDESMTDAAGDFAFISEGCYYFITSEVDSLWMKGRPVRINKTPGYVAVSCDVNYNALPPELKEYKGKTVYVYDSEGNVEETVIEELQLVVHYTPHFSQYQFWEMGETTDEEIAAEIFTQGYTGGGCFLAGALPVSQDFMGLWASLKKHRPQTCNTYEDEPLFKQVHAEMRKTAQWKEVQEEYRMFRENAAEEYPEYWSDYGYGEDMDAYRVTDSLGFVYLFCESGEMCGPEFYWQYIMIWKAEKGKKPVAVFSTGDIYGMPEAVVDTDGDHYPEFICRTMTGSLTLIKYDGSEWGNAAMLVIPFFDCPC